jgi:L-asparaginase
MASHSRKVMILATGGTIAGASRHAGDNVGYTAGRIGIGELVAAVPPLAGVPLEVQQVAQIDSKDMSHELWRELAAAVQAALGRADVAGVVITHGTDTLEETAYWLHRTVRATRPVVLTAAMRPATSLQADGPQNLLDAVALAREAGARGVMAVLAGRVLAGHELRKLHSYRLDAFESGGQGPLAWMVEGRVRQLRAWPEAGAGSFALPRAKANWPWVEIVQSHAGVDGRAIEALLAAGVHGLVLACTGNGTWHHALQPALARARSAGVPVLRATRCMAGGIVGPLLNAPAAPGAPGAQGVQGAQGAPGMTDALESAGELSPVQARIELMLRLMAAGAAPV